MAIYGPPVRIPLSHLPPFLLSNLSPLTMVPPAALPAPHLCRVLSSHCDARCPARRPPSSTTLLAAPSLLWWSTGTDTAKSCRLGCCSQCTQMEVEQAMCPGRGGGHGAGPRATLARWPCWEVENDLDVGSTCHRDKVRGKNIHSVGLEKQNVKENHKIF
jgi:hypothetical protein